MVGVAHQYRPAMDSQPAFHHRPPGRVGFLARFPTFANTPRYEAGIRRRRRSRGRWGHTPCPTGFGPLPAKLSSVCTSSVSIPCTDRGWTKAMMPDNPCLGILPGPPVPTPGRSESPAFPRRCPRGRPGESEALSSPLRSMKRPTALSWTAEGAFHHRGVGVQAPAVTSGPRACSPASA